MSHFLSAVEKNGELFYLTTADIESSRGAELLEYTKEIDDLRGHGAIRWFYGITGGQDIEYRNFKTPQNIPEDIVSKILGGYEFCQWFGLPPPRILSPSIYTDGVKRAIRLITDYYELKNPPTFMEYKSLILALHQEYWLKIRDEKNRMRPWII